MKKIFSILMLAMLAVCSVALVSCGDDDDEKGGSGAANVLVGTWRRNISENDYYTYTFNSNGTGVFNRPSWNVTEYFSYKIMSYDAGSGRGQVLEMQDGQSRTIDFTLVGNSLVYEGGTVLTKVN